jgi:hypothetical protein
MVDGVAVCPGSDTNDEKIRRNPGTPLWLESFGNREITGVALTRSGEVLLAQSDTQTSKLASDGSLIWSQPFGALVATTPDERGYVAGTFSGAVTLGEHRLEASGGRDVYLAELAADGGILSAVALGGTEDDDAQSLVVDARGVVVSGPGLGTIKLNASGQVLWQKPFFGRVALDSQGNVIVTGALVGERDYGAGKLESRGGSDVLVVKLSPEGRTLFSRSFGDAGALQQGEGVSVDRHDNLIVTGTFDGSIDFGAGALSLKPGACSADAWCLTNGFIAKLDADGHALWSLSTGPMRQLSGVASDGYGKVFVSGALPGGVRPFKQVWLGAFDAEGLALWQQTASPGTGVGAGHDIAVNDCAELAWSASARPSFEEEEQSYVGKLSL